MMKHMVKHWPFLLDTLWQKPITPKKHWENPVGSW